jgi:hypothetical protein
MDANRMVILIYRHVRMALPDDLYFHSLVIFGTLGRLPLIRIPIVTSPAAIEYDHRVFNQ